jgi:hypothetical protein
MFPQSAEGLFHGIYETLWRCGNIHRPVRLEIITPGLLTDRAPATSLFS